VASLNAVVEFKCVCFGANAEVRGVNHSDSHFLVLLSYSVGRVAPPRRVVRRSCVRGCDRVHG
jgi:hypothetical protein